MANPLAYPINPAPRTLAEPIKLSAEKLASWQKAGINAGVCHDEHVLLFDAAGKLVPANKPAHLATYAVWVNVATRYDAAGALTDAIRKAAGKRGEVKLPAGDEARAKLASGIADVLTSMVASKPKREPKAQAPAVAETVEAGTPIEA